MQSCWHFDKMFERWWWLQIFSEQWTYEGRTDSRLKGPEGDWSWERRNYCVSLGHSDRFKRCSEDLPLERSRHSRSQGVQHSVFGLECSKYSQFDQCDVQPVWFLCSFSLGRPQQLWNILQYLRFCEVEPIISFVTCKELQQRFSWAS